MNAKILNKIEIQDGGDHHFGFLQKQQYLSRRLT